MDQKVTKTGRLTESERKRLAVLDNALAMMLEDGFDGMNMDELSERALVSKATIYNRFGSKEDLFVAVVEHSVTQNRDKIITDDLYALPAKEGLGRMALELALMFGRDDDMLRMCKLCIVAADRFPIAMETFFENGPSRGTQQMADCIQHWQKTGELIEADSLFAAQQLAELCKTSIFDNRLYGSAKKATIAICESVADQAVLTFLARYQTTKSA